MRQRKNFNKKYCSILFSSPFTKILSCLIFFPPYSFFMPQLYIRLHTFRWKCFRFHKSFHTFPYYGREGKEERKRRTEETFSLLPLFPTNPVNLKRIFWHYVCRHVVSFAVPPKTRANFLSNFTRRLLPPVSRPGIVSWITIKVVFRAYF